MPRWPLLLVLASFVSACTGAGTPLVTSPAPTVTASPVPSLPAGVPPSFDDDVGPGDVPAAALIPLGGEVTGSWSAQTASGEAIVVAWSMPGPDPFRLDRGIAAWRRFDDGGAPWRPVWGAAYPGRREALQNLTADVADVSGDGSSDAIVSADIGGSGGCGTVFVVDLVAAQRIYRSFDCDRIVVPSTDPVGLSVREAIYRPGDAHCCPSEVRTTVLVYTDGAWTTASETTSPA